MTELEKFLHNVSSQVTLSNLERSQIREKLENLMNHDEGVFPVTATQSPWANTMFFIRRHSVSMAFITLLFFTGTTGAIADRALPGDFLYSLKTNVNEEVLGWFSVSDYDKAELSLRLAERRLLEAETIEEKEIDPHIKESHRVLLEKQINDADAKALRFETPISSKKLEKDVSLRAKEGEPTAFQATMMTSSMESIAQPPVSSGSSERKESVREEYIQKKEDLRDTFKALQKRVFLLKKRKQLRETLIPIEAQLIKVQKMLLDARRIKNDEIIMETPSMLLVDIETALHDVDQSLTSLENFSQNDFETSNKELPKLDEQRDESKEKSDNVETPGVL